MKATIHPIWAGSQELQLPELLELSVPELLDPEERYELLLELLLESLELRLESLEPLPEYD